MAGYLKFLKAKMYFAVILICGFAMMGSVFGARKESCEPVEIYGLSNEDGRMIQPGQGNMPELAEALPLAADQNYWYNFKYAAIFAMAGGVAFCILMVVYMPFYNKRMVVSLRSRFCPEKSEDDLFINLF